MKKVFKYSAIILCVTLLVSLVALFAMNNSAKAADTLPEVYFGEWGNDAHSTFLFGKGTTADNWKKTSYDVKTDSNYSGQYIEVGSTKYYLIDAGAEFMTIISGLSSNTANCYFIIANDIDLGKWTSNYTVYYTVIEGCGNKITLGNGSTKGLFSNYGGDIYNLVLEGTISANDHAAPLAVWHKGGNLVRVINKINLTVDLSAKTVDFGGYLGGIIAQAGNDSDKYAASSSYNTIISHCENYGKIEVTKAVGNGKKDQTRVCGFVGQTNCKTLIENCTNYGAISHVGGNVDNGVGGIVAVVNEETVIKNCSNEGNVTASTHVGGLVGLSKTKKLTVESSVNKGNVTAINSGSLAGGIVGSTQNALTVISCENIGTVKAYSHAGGILGRVHCGNAIEIKSCKNKGSVISETDMAAGILGRVWSDNSTITITDCNNEKGATVTGKSSSGGILGYHGKKGTLTIENCHNLGSVTDIGKYAGGIAGWFECATNGVTQISFTANIRNCTNQGTVEGSDSTAGIVGKVGKYMSLTIDNCDNSGSARSTASNHGAGILGDLNGASTMVVKNCDNLATAVIGGYANAAGIVGSTANATVEILNCNNFADISVSGKTVAGIVAVPNGTVTIKECTNNGDISGSNVGGIMGNNGGGNIIDCVNYGDITGTSNTGGIAGYISTANTVVKSCENYGKVTSFGSTGGIVGKAHNGITIEECTNLGAISTQGSGENAAAGIIACVRQAGKVYNIVDCVNLGNVTSYNKDNNTYASGILGVWKAYPTINVTGCVNEGTIAVDNSASAWGYISGIVGGPVHHNKFDNNSTSQSGTVKIVIDGCTNNGTLTRPSGGADCAAFGGIMAFTGNAGSGTDSNATYDNKIELTIKNCISTGLMDDSKFTSKNNTRLGDILGRADVSNSDSFVKVTNCLSTAKADSITALRGIVYSDDTATGKVTVENCWWTDETLTAPMVGTDVAKNASISFINCELNSIPKLSNALSCGNVARIYSDIPFIIVSGDEKIVKIGSNGDIIAVGEGETYLVLMLADNANSEGAYVTIPVEVKHNYSYKYDGSGSHWTVCACGFEGEKQAHVMSAFTPLGNTTCTKDGVAVATCKLCGVMSFGVDKAKGHILGEYVSDGNATCTADGTKTAKCTGCDEVKDTVADVGSAKGHSFTKYTSNNDATCKADGTKTAKCDACDVTDTKADEGSKKAEHKFGEFAPDGNATCLSDGTKSRKCEWCGKLEYLADDGSATGHVYDDGECKNCGLPAPAAPVQTPTPVEQANLLWLWITLAAVVSAGVVAAFIVIIIKKTK